MKAALYADDLVMWRAEEHATTATYRMQQASLHHGPTTGASASTREKSSTTLFTLSNKQKARAIKIGKKPAEDKEPTYLGVTYDKRQTWTLHIQRAQAKAKRELVILRKLAGTTWGANESILKTICEGPVRPHPE